MTEADLKIELKNGLSGVYLLAGEEEYLKRYYLLKMRESVLCDESFASFNHTSVNYLDGGFGALTDGVSMTPFMQEKRLCELSGFNFNSAKDAQLKALASIVSEAEDNDECVFIIYADTDLYDASKGSKTATKVRKALGDGVKTIVFDKTTPAKLSGWIKRHVEHEGLSISEGECRFMIEHCGRSMQVLSGEIAKVCSYKHAKGEAEIRREDIVYICAKNEEVGVFALANSVLEGNITETFRVLGEYKRGDGDVKPKGILSSVSSVYGDLCMVKGLLESGYDEAAISKKLAMHEYKTKLYVRTAKGIPSQKLERAMALCIEADTDMKLGVVDYIALERLLCNIAFECRR